MKAREIAESVLREMRRTDVYTVLPNIDSDWLRGWKMDYGVVYRKPNRRFKVKNQYCLRGFEPGGSTLFVCEGLPRGALGIASQIPCMASTRSQYTSMKWGLKEYRHSVNTGSPSSEVQT